MEVLTARETAARLPYAALADAIREVALARSSGSVQAPPRIALPLRAKPGAVLLVMPASDAEIAITKLVTVHPDNAGHNLPTIQGEVVVMEAETGTRLGLLDGATVTARRTAALSLLAARELAPRPDAPLLIVGAGAQARSHLEAFAEGLGVSKVFLTSRTRERAEALAARARELGVEAAVAESPEEALSEVGLIVTATTSREPVLPEGVRDGTFVAAVGSFEPEAAELPPGLISGSTVVVDTIEGAKEEAGDLIRAEQAGAFSWSDATSLEDALRDEARPTGTVVFESVGHALWDLAAARAAFAR
ncbi:delta(1)-pyrroline-2-carboxylate reductase family protein [Rubrobacter tropicus]|uniref:Delta(1)-pyrroline-2-carboxylate reductase family protein n=1 Tax=Rubrobacter tropicus TaxID=2653851 RepID=A0A6G8QC64_9ACTN|nr:delta(1)-pyrroline-2-carboxylate reductase family protein [Rubrobacter tropicus]QIN84069.1 delta(1)-pyrroline-2-carboxylate reductase family protein [Rubrobacter tropicus]